MMMMMMVTAERRRLHCIRLVQNRAIGLLSLSPPPPASDISPRILGVRRGRRRRGVPSISSFRLKSSVPLRPPTYRAKCRSDEDDDDDDDDEDDDGARQHRSDTIKRREELLR